MEQLIQSAPKAHEQESLLYKYNTIKLVEATPLSDTQMSQEA